MNVPLMKHNPAFLTPEQLRASFVVRKRDLDIVLQYIRDSTGPSNQHVLVLGSRGMGKTTLVRMVAETVRQDPELGARWYPLVFGEESYTVSSIGELWLEAILHLADQTGEPRWQALHDELRAERDDEKLCDRALARLVEFAEQQGKRIVLIVENLHMLLDEQMREKDAWSLRHTLQNEPRILLLATATSRFGAVVDEKQALYEMFATYALEPLDLVECRALWVAVGGVEASERRVRPMQILTGGNPRLLSILASFGAKTSLRYLMENLTQLVDDNTDYFKSHLEALPATERKVYVTLADLWAPATAREVADAARMEVNQASALLHRLVGRGAVLEEGNGRRLRYRLSERMYNIYHLLRRRGAGAARVRAVVDFMVHLYEGDGLVGLIERIAEEAKGLGPEERRDHFDVIEGILQNVHEPELTSRLFFLIVELGLPDWPGATETLKSTMSHVARRVQTHEKKAAAVLQRELEVLARLKELIDTGRHTEAGGLLESLAESARTREDRHKYIRWATSEYMEHELYLEAERCARMWLRLEPNAPQAIWEFAVALYPLNIEQRQRLTEEYEREAASGETWAWAALTIARLHHMSPINAIEAHDSAKNVGIDNPFLTAMMLIHVFTRLPPADADTWRKRHTKDVSQARPWVGRLLALHPDPGTRVISAKVLMSENSWEEACSTVKPVLTSEDDARKAAAELRSFFIEAAAAGRVDDALTLLEEAAVKALFEPIDIALRQLADKPVHAPPELLEVASDVMKVIQQKRTEREHAKLSNPHTPRKEPKSGPKRRSAGKGRAAAER